MVYNLPVQRSNTPWCSDNLIARDIRSAHILQFLHIDMFISGLILLCHLLWVIKIFMFYYNLLLQVIQASLRPTFNLIWLSHV